MPWISYWFTSVSSASAYCSRTRAVPECSGRTGRPMRVPGGCFARIRMSLTLAIRSSAASVERLVHSAPWPSAAREVDPDARALVHEDLHRRRCRSRRNVRQWTRRAAGLLLGHEVRRGVVNDLSVGLDGSREGGKARRYRPGCAATGPPSAATMMTGPRNRKPSASQPTGGRPTVARLSHRPTPTTSSTNGGMNGPERRRWLLLGRVSGM